MKAPDCIIVLIVEEFMNSERGLRGRVPIVSGDRAASRYNSWRDCPDDVTRDLILDRENIFERSIETLRPEVVTAVGFDQLGGYANTVAGFPDAAFEHVAHTKFSSYLTYIGRFSFIGK